MSAMGALLRAFDSKTECARGQEACDTAPCAEVERLAQGADVLIHEATGESYGHTSPAQAGEVARRSGARSLYLIHYPTQGVEGTDLIRSARESFSGPVELAKDFLELEF